MATAVRAHSFLLPVVVVALVVAALFFGLERSATTQNLKPIQSTYEAPGSPSAVSPSSTAQGVTAAANFTG
jgi:hypothetical protein